MRLVDGLNNTVGYTKEEIKDALLRTDLVQDDEGIISLSRFFGGDHPDGDEYDVYDERQKYDPQTVYSIDEVDEAVEYFQELVDEFLY